MEYNSLGSIKVQILLIWIATILSLITQAFKYPLILTNLKEGADAFYILTSTLALMAVFEFGLTAVAMRHVGRKIKRNNQTIRYIAEYYESFFPIWAVTGMIACLSVFYLYINIADRTLLAKYSNEMYILIVGYFFSLGISYRNSNLVGLGFNGVSSIIDAVTGLLSLIAIYYILSDKSNVSLAIIIETLRLVASAILKNIMASKVYSLNYEKRRVGVLRKLNKILMLRQIKTGSASAIMIIFSGMDGILIDSLYQANSAALLLNSQSIMALVASQAIAIVASILPRILHEKKSAENFDNKNSSALLFYALTAGIITVFSRDIMELWIGGYYHRNVLLFSLIYLGYSFEIMAGLYLNKLYAKEDFSYIKAFLALLIARILLVVIFSKIIEDPLVLVASKTFALVLVWGLFIFYNSRNYSIKFNNQNYLNIIKTPLKTIFLFIAASYIYQEIEFRIGLIIGLYALIYGGINMLNKLKMER